MIEEQHIDCKKCQYIELVEVPWDYNRVWWCNKFDFEIHNVEDGECMAYEPMDSNNPEI